MNRRILNNRKTLITGASEGIGRAFARRLASEGYAVTAVARTESRLAELMTELGEEGRHRYIVADLSTENGLAKVANDLETNHYDIFLNNAGFGIYKNFTECPDSTLRDIVNVNIVSMMMLAKTYLKTAQPGDSLMNISSVLGMLPLAGGSVYSASKAFVTSFSESLWFEQKNRGVYIVGLCPGATESNFHSRAGGRDGDIPKAFFQTAERVVETGMQALKSRSNPTVVSGALNRVTLFLTRLLPRKLTVIMTRLTIRVAKS